MNSFTSELEMTEKLLKSKQFLSYCLTLFGDAFITKEFKGYFGIPDLVIFDVNEDNMNSPLGKAVAIELKLSNWKRAIEQAYRYKAFADLSLVVIDASRIKPVLHHVEYFKKSRIGLISFSVESDLNEIYLPPLESPYATNLRTKLEKLDFFQYQQLTELCVN